VSSFFRIRAALAVTAGVIWLAAAGAGTAQAKSSAKSPSKSASTQPAAAAGTTAPAVPAWVAKSNQNAQLLLDVLGKFAPEGAGRLGVDGYDEKIFDLTTGYEDRTNQALATVKTELEKRLAAETDPPVKEDLAILVQAVDQNLRGNALDHKYNLPMFDMDQLVFQGLRGLLDDQVPAQRRAAALVRLERYAGMEKGYTPIAELAQARIRERMGETGLRRPFKDELEKNLSNGPRYVDGIAKLFTKYQIKGWEKPYDALKTQLAAYDDFVRKEILTQARTDFRQPAELYSFSLEQFGVDMPVEELQSRAKTSFQETQRAMQALAPLVAKEKGWTVTDYRDVIKSLKKEQLQGDAILALYKKRIGDVEEIIRRESIVTLPNRPMSIELSSEAEAAAIPAPNMQAPRLIGNTGERGVFKLPLQVPGAPGEQDKKFDDFTFEAASWTLTAHEGRPGHELQFSSVVERGASLARAIFAFNSVNVEGWGLYAEAELYPYEPLEGQLIALQHRLMRNARAFLDPGMQLGTITRDEAYRLLRDDVVLSDAMATEEVERYMFWAPGQAPSYFNGYSRLLEIRENAQRALGPRFDRKRFNDFILSQGMLTPALLSKAVNEEFIPAATQASAN
jgi:hypothetical protein